MPAPVLRDIVRQHAEMAALLWTIYDRHLQFPDENPELDEDRVSRLIERIEAHLDGLCIAGRVGQEIAQECYEKFPEPGELFVVQVLKLTKKPILVADLDISKIRRWIAANA